MVVTFKGQSLKYSWQETVFYQNLLGAVFFAPIFFFANPLPNAMQVSGAMGYGILVGIIAYGLFFIALKQIKASTASLLAYIEVLSAILIGVVFFEEILSWNLILGGALIIISAILIRK